MAKELPYFRFTVQEWQNGDIGIESYELKGLFIDICGFYWIKDCTITLSMLQKRFSNATNLLEQLISLGILKVDESENIDILFLNDQFDLLSEKRKKRQIAGRKGGLSKSSNAKAMLEQNSSYKDKDKEKYNIKKDIQENVIPVALEEEKHNDVFRKLWKNQYWIEQTSMKYKSDVEDTREHLNGFREKLLLKGDLKSNQKDAQTHFINWIDRGNPIPKKQLKPGSSFTGF